MYVTLLVSQRDWLPAFLLLVQGDFHLPSSNSKIKKGPSVLSPSLPSLLWSFVLIISNTNLFSPMSSVYCLVCQVHVLIFPSVCYAFRCFLPPWHVYLPNPGVLMWVSLLCQRTPENLQLTWGLRRGYSTGVHAPALNVDCEGEVLAALLCLFHVDGCFLSGERLKYSHTLKVRCAFHSCMDFYKITLTAVLSAPKLQPSRMVCPYVPLLRPFSKHFQFAGDYGPGLILPKSFLQ